MNIKCPWCESENNSSFLKLKDYFLSQEEFEIYECEECKLLFTIPCPPPSEIGNYYKSEDYLSHNEKKKGIVPTIYNFVKGINIKNKYRITTGEKKVSLLDIGCGVGDFLLYAKKNGCKITGIEPNEDARNIAEKKLGNRIHSPEELQNIPNNSFDVITMWHVLEHVENLKEEIFHLQRLLKNNGRLILALPNFKSYDAIIYKDKWAAYDVPRHVNHFSEESIKNIFKRTNLQLIDIKPLKWDSYYISMLSEKYCNHSYGFIRGCINGWKSNIKARKSGQYSSLVYVLKKSDDMTA
ncbi:MAG: class I SAM-dependent methyltransferase [Bacteroidales bacterium]|nr:class I SAM-dependent methyltransferase [Bacteroidales bacterium]